MTNASSKTLNIFLWAAQVLLASGFLWSTSVKLFYDPIRLSEMWPWTADHLTLVRFTAVVDFLAGMGFVLPGLFRIQPKLIGYTAIGTILLMIAASTFHITRGEVEQIGVNIFFAAIAAFIAWGRLRAIK